MIGCFGSVWSEPSAGACAARAGNGSGECRAPRCMNQRRITMMPTASPSAAESTTTFQGFGHLDRGMIHLWRELMSQKPKAFDPSIKRQVVHLIEDQGLSVAQFAAEQSGQADIDRLTMIGDKGWQRGKGFRSWKPKLRIQGARTETGSEGSFCCAGRAGFPIAAASPSRPSSTVRECGSAYASVQTAPGHAPKLQSHLAFPGNPSTGERGRCIDSSTSSVCRHVRSVGGEKPAATKDVRLAIPPFGLRTQGA